jgi:LysM repeat protein
VLLAGGGAAVVLVVALARRSSGGSGSQASTTVPNTYDSTLSDIEAEWQNEFEALQGQIANLTPTPTNGTGSSGGNTPAPPTVIQGGAPPRSVVPPVMVRPLIQPASHTQAVVRVQQGNTLSGIAARFGETWQQVWNYNLTPGVRPAATQATLRQRGPNLLFSGEEIDIPSK